MAQRVMFGDELLFPKDYISNEELEGKDMVLTIDSISKEELVVKRGPRKKKPILTFKERNGRNDNKPYKLVLNTTNANTIAAMHGYNALADWPGKKIIVYPTMTQFGPETVPCLRVREKPPAEDKPKPPADSLHKGWHDAIDKAETEEQLLAVAKKFDETKAKGKKTPYQWPAEQRAEFGAHYDLRMEQLKAPQPPAKAPAPREPGDESPDSEPPP